MPGENLTRVEAQERKALVDVASYEVALDLTTGDETFRQHDDRDASRRRPGHRPSSTPSPAPVHSVTLNGDGARRGRGQRRRAHPARRPRRPRTSSPSSPTPLYTNTGEGLHRFVDPVDGEVYLYSQFEVPDSPPRVRGVRAARPQGDVPVHRDRARARGQVVSNSPTPEPTDARRRRRDLGVRADPAHLVATSPRSSPARTRSCAPS